jgi:hypothetical protein
MCSEIRCIWCSAMPADNREDNCMRFTVRPASGTVALACSIARSTGFVFFFGYNPMIRIPPEQRRARPKRQTRELVRQFTGFITAVICVTESRRSL